MKIIGFFIVASAFGVFVYYSWWKPSSDVSGSSSSTNTPQKSVGALQWLYQIPKNLIGAIQSFRKNPHQKITVQNWAVIIILLTEGISNFLFTYLLPFFFIF